MNRLSAKLVRGLRYTRSTMVARPCPTPMHIGHAKGTMVQRAATDALLIGIAAVKPLVRPLVHAADPRPRVPFAEREQPQTEERLSFARCDQLEHEPVRRGARLALERQVQL
jgi:hypothetical protein